MAKRKIPPLIVERLVDDTNLCFLSLIEYRRVEYIGIINDITNTHVKAYTFENERPDVISINDFISAITKWYYSESYQKPLSISLSQHGYTQITAPLFKSFELAGVSRIVGNPFIFSHLAEENTRKKKVLAIPEGIPVTLKRLN